MLPVTDASCYLFRLFLILILTYHLDQLGRADRLNKQKTLISSYNVRIDIDHRNDYYLFNYNLD